MTEPLSPAPGPTGGPPAFVFTPSQPSLSGPAFGPIYKALAWGMAAALLVWMLRLQLPWRQGNAALMWAAWALLAYTAWVVQRSQLRLDTQRISQDWMWRKQMAIAELASLKILRVRGLQWLMAPRIYVRTLQGRFAVFYCADPLLLAEFERMRQELDLWRTRILHGG